MPPAPCANPDCTSWTAKPDRICARCAERGFTTPAPEPFDRGLASRTSTGCASAARTKKKERREDEHLMQVQLVNWCRSEGGELAPPLKRIIAIPNGAAATKMMNIRMWKEGRAKGFPDLFLPVPLGPYHGAMLELKREGEVPDADQFGWLESLALDSYHTSWSDNLAAAKDWLLAYGTLSERSE